MSSRWALVSDFDGTVSEDDFFWYVADHFLTPQDLEPWKMYMRGEISHLEAMRGVFSKLHVREEELQRFIDTIYTDKYLEETASYCHEEGIPFYIASAGCDYYINRLIGHIIKKYDIHLVTNHGVYDINKGLELFPPKSSPFYDEDVGISKLGVVRFLKKEGYKVVFAGDGPPDVLAAKEADVVFAKKYLLEKCLENKIKNHPFTTFRDILKYLKEA